MVWCGHPLLSDSSDGGNLNLSTVERAADLGDLPLDDAKVLGSVLGGDGGPWGELVHSTDSVLRAPSLELSTELVEGEVVGLWVHFHV